jgi:hypothetical protein
MRVIFLILAAIALPAQADLYRWVDPDTGSIKYSSLPPEDPRVNAQGVPFKAPPAPPPAALPAAMTAQPAQDSAVAALEARWSELLKQLSGLMPQDFSRAGQSVKQQLDSYSTLTTELDRLDPAGTERRRMQSEPLLERIRQGLAAQVSPSSPVPPKK